MSLIHRWHTTLNMPKYDEAWHVQDIADELAEYHEARGLVEKWSELSDIAYTYTRTNWSGHTNVILPISKPKYYIGLLYMFPKYTLRWRFFRALGHHFDKNLHLTEVRNPKKLEKLESMAQKHNLDPEQFKAEAARLLRKRILLK
jgi:hypothetical protein